MRITQPLCKQLHKWIFEQKWKIIEKRPLYDLGVPKKLLEQKLKMHDALDLAKVEKPYPVENKKFVFPDPYNEKPPMDSNHPDFKERKCYIFNSNIKLLEALPHVQVLTKTLQYEGLPNKIKQLEGIAKHIEQDNLVQRAIKHSRLWDCWQVPLPRPIETDRPLHEIPRVWSVPAEKQSRSLLRDLLHLLEPIASKQVNVLDRCVIGKSWMTVPLEKDGKLLQYQCWVDSIIASRYPLDPIVSDKGEIAATIENDLPDLFPISCFLDLDQTNFYDDKSLFPFNPDCAWYGHTLFVTHVDHYLTDEMEPVLAKTIGICHAYCIAQARHFYGAEVRELSIPVTVQCVLQYDKKFTFLVYQLNSLDVNGVNGVKNMLWADGPHDLFGTCELDRAYGSRLLDYNPDVFRKFLAFYVNGKTVEKTKMAAQS